MTRMHEKVGTINHSIVAGKLAKRIDKIRWQLDRVLRIGMLVVREVLPPQTSYLRCCVDSLSGKDLSYDPALISWLVKQGKWLETLSP